MQVPTARADRGIYPSKLPARRARITRGLLAFAEMSAEAAPFVPLAESVEVRDAVEALAERIIARGEDARGITLPALSFSRSNDILAGLNAAVSLQRWWRARQTERDAARLHGSPVENADDAAPVAAALPATN